MVLLALVALAAFTAGCSKSGSGSAAKGKASSESDGATETTTAPGDDASATTLPPGAVPGLDDYDGDGQLDPTCGTQDFGGGLVLRVPCHINTANDPADGTTLVKDSLFRLPGSTDIDLTGISGSLVLARDAGGAKVVIVVFNSDNLFETGSSDIGSTDTVDGTIRLINARYPGGAVQVRGHTDSVGSAASNQALSERRATTVRDYLKSHGLKATDVTAIGFGSTRPLTEERKPDGSDNPEGRAFNRRVEIVVRPPK